MSQDPLHSRHHLIEAVLQGGHIGHWVWFIKEDRFDYTDTWPEALNYEPQAFARSLEAFGELIHPDDVAGLIATFEAGEKAESRFSADIRMKDCAGHYQHMRVTGKVVERTAEGEALIASGAIENITAEREREENRRLLLDGMPVFVGLLDMDSRVVEANGAATAFIQQERADLLGERFWEAPGWPLNQEHTDEVRAAVDKALKGDLQQVEIAWHITDTITRYIDMTVSPLYDTNNNIIGCIPSGSDVTQRKLMEQQEALLMRELQHRVKNTLAIIQGLASQIMRQAATKEDAAQTLSLQLQALASAHDMLVDNNWSATSMQNIVERLRDEHDISSSRIHAHGPAVKFPQKSTVMLTLALHELRTNAIKHGALSQEEGLVEISWTFDASGPGTFEMVWKETGGPPVKEPQDQGFGALLLLRIFPAEFRGQAEFNFSTEGFSYVMRGVLPVDVTA